MKGKALNTLVIRLLFALAVPAAATAGAAVMVYHPAAHQAFCEGK